MFTKILIEDNGTDVCLAKVGSVIAFVLYNVYALWGLYNGHFALGEYGNGLMQLFVGCAAAIAGKNWSTKPGEGQ